MSHRHFTDPSRLPPGPLRPPPGRDRPPPPTSRVAVAGYERGTGGSRPGPHHRASSFEVEVMVATGRRQGRAGWRARSSGASFDFTLIHLQPQIGCRSEGGRDSTCGRHAGTDGGRPSLQLSPSPSISASGRRAPTINTEPEPEPGLGARNSWLALTRSPFIALRTHRLRMVLPCNCFEGANARGGVGKRYRLWF